MKYIITESRLEKAIIEYLDKEFIPDYGWYENGRKAGTYQDDVDKWGDLVFFIDDVDSYIYFGCNANNGPEDDFFADYGHLHNYECPLLLVYPAVSQQLSNYFGDMWKPIFKKWFEENTGLTVNQITDDYI
jgi:hypothetical protein